jgi:hypothetical protein
LVTKDIKDIKDIKGGKAGKMKTIKLIILIAFFSLALGCGSTRVVFVDTQSDLIRIGPDFPRGKVYILKNGEWVLSKNKVKLPEGWYAGGIPKEE